MDNFLYEHDKALRRLFSKQIKGSFLMKMMHAVRTKMGEDLFKYYDLQVTHEKLVTTGMDSFDYDICRHIVGVHRSNMVFVDERNRVKMENSSDYQSQLVNETIANIKLRLYGSFYFRQKSLIKGDNFLFFHLPYDLFVMSLKMSELLQSKKQHSEIDSLYIAICNKAVAVLTLMEDGFFDSAYPICRGIIELYIKLLLVKLVPDSKEEMFLFSQYDLEKSCLSKEYSEEFNNAFKNRINKSSRNKVDYLHYGWVDAIKDYHNIVKNQPYSINGLMEYLKNCYEEEQLSFFEHLEFLYKMCHGYAHGNIVYSKYPLLHYFEISLMIYYTLRHTFVMFCEEEKIDSCIEDCDIVAKADKDYALLFKQYLEKSTEKFEQYYKERFKN